MPTGRSSGLNYDDWFTVTPSWDIDDIRHQLPLYYNEAIVIAILERWDGLGKGTVQGRPPDTGINFRDIASAGFAAKASLADLVLDFTLDDIDVWVDYRDSGGVWHNEDLVAPEWTEEELALDIDPLGSGELSELDEFTMPLSKEFTRSYDYMLIASELRNGFTYGGNTLIGLT
jgi:hypothetical protein